MYTTFGQIQNNIGSADGMGRELFYVAASRERDRVTVVTSDAEAR
jgi:ATP-dependent exoDNAse (exonuclease V) alpha subunit